MAQKQRDSNEGPVRYNLYLSSEAYNKLVKLKELTGKSSLSDTVRSAIDMYHLIEEMRTGNAPWLNSIDDHSSSQAESE